MILYRVQHLQVRTVHLFYKRYNRCTWLVRLRLKTFCLVYFLCLSPYSSVPAIQVVTLLVACTIASRQHVDWPVLRVGGQQVRARDDAVALGDEYS